MNLAWRVCAPLSLLVLAGCTGHGGAAPLFPASTTFGWQLKTVTEDKAAHSWRAEYTGPGNARVEAFETPTGLDRMQHWQAKANTVAVFNTRYFIVIAWDKADRSALTALTRSLEKLN